MKKSICIVFLNIFIPLLVGVIIYLWIDRDVYFLRVLRDLGLIGSGSESLGKIANLLRNYGCDVLWAYALSFAILLIFASDYMQALFFCIGFETVMEGVQIIPSVSGTFDWRDLLLEWAVSISVFMYYKMKGNEHEKIY